MNCNKIDKENNSRGFQNEQLFKDLDFEIDRILQDDKANYPIFIKKEAKRLINDNHNIQEIINNANNRREEKAKILNNLKKYINMKRAEKNIKELEPKILEKKMIII